MPVHETVSRVITKKKLNEIYKASRIGERHHRQMSWGCARAGDWAERSGGRGARKEGGGEKRGDMRGMRKMWGEEQVGRERVREGGNEGCGRGASLWSYICHVSFFDAQ